MYFGEAKIIEQEARGFKDRPVMETQGCEKTNREGLLRKYDGYDFSLRYSVCKGGPVVCVQLYVTRSEFAPDVTYSICNGMPVVHAAPLFVMGGLWSVCNFTLFVTGYLRSMPRATLSGMRCLWSMPLLCIGLPVVRVRLHITPLCF